MKKLFIITFALLNVMSVIAENYVRSIEKEIQSVAAQKKSVTAKLEKAQNDFIEAQEKMEVLQDKPQSLPYKNALKKVEFLPAKIEEHSRSIQLFDQQLDSLNNLLLGAQESLQATEVAKEEALEEKKQAKAIAAEEKARMAPQNESTSVQPKYSQEISKPIESSVEKKKEISDEEWASVPWYEKIVALFFGGGWIILVFIVSFFRVIASLRCPKCGKWFTMEFVGGANTWSENHDRVFRKKYECSNCGYTRTTISPIPKKNK